MGFNNSFIGEIYSVQDRKHNSIESRNLWLGGEYLNRPPVFTFGRWAQIQLGFGSTEMWLPQDVMKFKLEGRCGERLTSTS